ncbi:MAG: AAA family ATPase, partial [Bacteroidetes bacterium]|nr:AAA family ATPase [Bacteroidota bacterium]
MLCSLYIRDYALIDELEVDFSTGLNIITGETGAGKSILVGALKLILGERAATDSIRTGARKAVIEGVFDTGDLTGVRAMLEDGGFDVQARLILRREVSEGHSRAFINDSPASVQQMRAIASELVDLHGQHEHQSLLRTEKHLEVVDGFGGLGGLVEAYRSRYGKVARLVDEREELRAKERELQQQKDLFAFQLQEIDATQPVEGEDVSLEADRRMLENAERLFTATASLFDVLYESDTSVNDQLVRVRNEIQDLVRIDPEFEGLLSEILSAQIAVEETAKSLQDYNSRIEFNQERLDSIRERLFELDHLKRRYGGTLEAVLA